MKLGVFWFGELNAEVRLAIDVLRLTEVAGLDVTTYTATPHGGSRQISIDKKTYPYEAVNAIQYGFEEADRNGLDFAIINFGSAVFLSAEKLNTFINSEDIQRAIFSFRVAPIVMASGTSSPRLPYVDDHFIILNVARAKKAEFFRRRLINASHFAYAGGNHSVLMSFVEYSMSKAEWCNYFKEEQTFDAFGRVCGLAPEPFLVCTRTGFATCYPEFNSKLKRLLISNLPLAVQVELSREYLDASAVSTRGFVLRDHFYFIRRREWIERSWTKFIRWFGKRYNYQYQKRYARV